MAGLDAKPVRWQIDGLDEWIDMEVHDEFGLLYVIRNNEGECKRLFGGWVKEPQRSKRDVEFIRETRYVRLDQAAGWLAAEFACKSC